MKSKTHTRPGKKEWRTGRNPPLIHLFGDPCRSLKIFRETRFLLFAWDEIKQERLIFFKTSKPRMYFQSMLVYTRVWYAYAEELKTINYKTKEPEDESIQALKEFVKNHYKEKWQKRADKEWEDKLTLEYEAWKNRNDKKEDDEFQIDIPDVKLTPTAEDAIENLPVPAVLRRATQIILNEESLLQLSLLSRLTSIWWPYLLAGIGCGIILMIAVFSVFPQVFYAFNS